MRLEGISIITKYRGGFRGEKAGGGGVDAPSQEYDPLPTQRVPLCTILRYPFLVRNPKIVLKAVRRQYILILKGERAPKKRDFLVKIFLKRFFVGLFFKI